MTTSTTPRSGYAPVNGLNMYYEIHGEGQPLLLLHGAFSGHRHLIRQAAAGPGRGTPGDRRRAAGPWPYGRHRSPAGPRTTGG